MDDFTRGYIKGISDYKEHQKTKIHTITESLREYSVLKMVKHFEMIKHEYFKEIYFDSEHLQLVMIAEDSFTVRLNLKTGE